MTRSFSTTCSGVPQGMSRAKSRAAASNLREWVAEKSGGRVAAEAVASLTIIDLHLNWFTTLALKDLNYWGFV